MLYQRKHIAMCEVIRRHAQKTIPNHDQLLNHSWTRDYTLINHKILLIRWVDYIKTAYIKTLTEMLHITTRNRARSTIKYCMSWHEIY